MDMIAAEVGCSGVPDTESAVREAFQRAQPASGEPRVSFVFTTDAHEPTAVWRAMHALAGPVPFVGFQCAGVLTREGVLLQGIGIATVSGEFSVATVLETGLDRDAWGAGQRAGKSLMRRAPEQGLAVLLPDGFAPGVYEVARSLYSQMGPDLRYIGGASGDSLKWLRTCQFTEVALQQNALAAAVIGGCEVGTAIGHGWEPRGEPLVITRARGKRVYEIDGRPAFKVYSEKLGVEIPRESFRRISMANPLGFVDMSGNYVIRDPHAVNDDDSLDFVTEVPSEAVAQLMGGDVDGLVATARTVAARAAGSVRSPRIALAFDCISRYVHLQEEYTRELQALVDGIGPDVPLLGALTFGEIGSFHEVPLFHNKAVAVAVLGSG